MNNADYSRKVKVNSSMYNQIQKSGVAILVQVLIDVEVLDKKDYENWRFGKIDYLERVCKVGLSKLSSIMKEVRNYAKAHNLKASETYYKRWRMKDKSKKIKLRFSKTANENIEKAYSTHYVDSKRIKELKEKDIIQN